MAFSPDGRWLATTHEDGTIALRDTADPRRRTTLGAHKATAVGTSFSFNGQWLATAAWDGTAKVWDLASHGLVTTLTGQLLGINCLAFSRDNRRLAVGSQDGSIKLWDTTLWQETATFETHKGEIFDMAFLPQDGTFVSLTREEIRVWPVSAGAVTQVKEKQ
jgi:WD40 repeat protein